MLSPVADNEALNKWMDDPVALVQGCFIAGSQGRKLAFGFLEFTLPAIYCGAALAIRPPGGFVAIVIVKLDYLKTFFDGSTFGIVENIIDVTHEANIAASVIIFYVDLLQSGSLSSPPRESNMFLNFFSDAIFFTRKRGANHPPLQSLAN